MKVPDGRVDFLSKVFQPKKTTYAEIIFVDFVGFESLSNSIETYMPALNQLKTVEALTIVCKLFDQEKSFSPSKDIENWQSDLLLALADLEVIENRLERMNKQSKGKKGRLLQVGSYFIFYGRVRTK